jgi:hypothetical protein
MSLRGTTLRCGFVAAIGALGLLGASVGRADAATYAEDPSDFRNPERGFYRTGYVNLLSTAYASNAARYADIYELFGQTLVYSRLLLADYRNLDHLPQSVLDTLATNLANLRGTGLKAAMRFRYGTGGSVDTTKTRMLNHIADLAPVFQAYADVIAYVEGGFIGDFGEWHSSENIDTNPSNDSTCGNRDIPDILDALHASVPSDRMVLMRYPRMQGRAPCAPYNTTVTPDTAYDGSNRSRTGIYNDALMCGKHNTGTFWCTLFDQEEAYWDRQSDFTLTVGEGSGREMGTCAGGDLCPKGPAGSLPCSTDANCVYSGVDYGPCVLDWHRCTKGMAFAAKHNLVATNDGVNTTGSAIVLDGLRTDSPECFTKFSKQLGYRYVLNEATWPGSVAVGASMNFAFTLRNDGFARLYNPRTVYVSLQGSGAQRDIALPIDPRFWSPNGATTTVTETVSIPPDLPPGTYEIGLWLPDAGPLLRDDAKYAIRFANDGTWDPASGINVLGTISVTPSGAVTTTTTTLLPPPPPDSTTAPQPTTTYTTTTTDAPTTTATTTTTETTSTTATTSSTSSTLPPSAAIVRVDEASVTSACVGAAADTITVPGVVVGTQSNRLLVVTVGAEEADTDCNLASAMASVRYGQAILTRAVSAVSDTSSWRACNGIFYLLDPPSGVVDVVINFPTSVAGAIDNRHAGAFVLYNVAQGPPAAVATAGADATTDPVVTTLTANAASSLVVDVFTQGEVGTFAPTSLDQMERWERSCTSSGSASSTRFAAAPGPITLGWDHSSPRRYAHSLAMFAPAGGAPTTTSTSSTTSTTTTTTTTTTTSTTTTTLPPSVSIGVDTATLRTACGASAADTITIPSVPVGAQANRILVVTVGAEENDADCNLGSSQVTVRYGTALLTRAVAALSDTSSWRACNGVFYLLNPATGTADVVVTLPSATTNRIDSRQAGAMVIYGAAQQAPTAIASAGADATANPISTTIAVATSRSLVVDVVTQGDAGSFVPNQAGQSERWDVTCGSSSSATATREGALPGSLPLGWSHSSPRRYAHALAAFRPAP